MTEATLVKGRTAADALANLHPSRMELARTVLVEEVRPGLWRIYLSSRSQDGEDVEERVADRLGLREIIGNGRE